MASENILDITEQKIAKGKRSYRPRPVEPPGRMRRELGRFISAPTRTSTAELHEDLARNAGTGLQLPDLAAILEDPARRPVVCLERMASGAALVEDEEERAAIWAVDDRLRCYDMEAGSFGYEAKKHQRMFAVFRGISDYGTPETRGQENRDFASLSAALFTRRFISHGLVDCHPRNIRVPELNTSELSADQFYSQSRTARQIPSLFLERVGVDVSELDLDRTLTLRDYFSYCRAATGLDRPALTGKLFGIRESYFADKYLDYSYDFDLRGVVPGWAQEVRQILSDQAIDLSVSDVLDVGCGNGLEIHELFHDAQSITGVDVSAAMIERARERIPSGTFHVAPAEDLSPILSNSIDVYVSLRTYTSRFFDVRAALGEAYRVLKPGGFVLISVPNGYSEHSGGSRKIVRGMLSPGSERLVNRSLPYEYRTTIRRFMTDYGWQSIFGHDKNTDIYLWAQKPQPGQAAA